MTYTQITIYDTHGVCAKTDILFGNPQNLLLTMSYRLTGF